MADYIGVDWGTSSFRLWAMRRDGEVLAERKGREGMSVLAPEEFGPALEAHLAALGVAPELPVVICGMAGARSGWQEARYLDLPVTLDGLAGAAIRVPGTRREIRILPGVAQRDRASPDVMRGEETMLLGAQRSFAASGTICMPGTHSKWAVLEAGALIRFHTAMTGEAFALFARHSTLAEFIDTERFDVGGFAVGVRAGLAQPEASLRHLFHLRAGPLLDLIDRETAAARLSGLLIGLEIAGAPQSEAVTLIASGILAARYQQALDWAGREVRLLDADAAVRAGLAAAAADLWPDMHNLETIQ